MGGALRQGGSSSCGTPQWRPCPRTRRRRLRPYLLPHRWDHCPPAGRGLDRPSSHPPSHPRRRLMAGFCNICGVVQTGRFCTLPQIDPVGGIHCMYHIKEITPMTYTLHEHIRSAGNCVHPFDVRRLEPCDCDEGNISMYPDCSCIDCYQQRQADCAHARTHTDPYGYSECLDCGADQQSPVNPLTKCYRECAHSSYGLCPADCKNGGKRRWPQ